MATMIDTLGYVKKLTAAGFSREQAEAQAEAFRDDIATQVVTKTDLDAGLLHLETDMNAGFVGLRTDLDAGLLRLKTEMDAGFVGLRTDLDTGLLRLRTDMDSGFVRLDHRIDNLEARVDTKFTVIQGQITLLHWMCGFTLALSVAMLWMLVRIATGK